MLYYFIHKYDKNFQKRSYHYEHKKINNRAYRIILSGEEQDVIFVRSNASGYANGEYKITIVRYEGTKTNVSKDGKSFTVTPINVEAGNLVILALYNGDKFVEMQKTIYEGDAVHFTTNKSYTNAKVMAWDDLTNLKPVCEAEEILIAQ